MLRREPDSCNLPGEISETESKEVVTLVDLVTRLGRAYIDQELLRTGSEFTPDIHPADDLYQALGLASGNRPEGRHFYCYKSGYDAFRSLEHVLTSAGRSFSELGSVLELACGHGRVTGFLAREIPARQIWCSDILTGAVDFVTDTFGVRGINSARKPADLVFDRTFDLIFVASLFSHLPRRRFLGWLKALHKGLSPNGLLVFSTHGASRFPQIKMHRSGFTFVPLSESCG